MQQSEQEVLLSSLGMTAEIMGTQVQPAALVVMADDLSAYDLQDVLNALKRCRSEETRFTLKAVMDRIHAADGIPGADEAWGLMSRPESDTIVITEEMAEAMQDARGLLNDGDKTGARMAFRDSYTRLVALARDRKLKPKWFVSLGHDKDGRAQPIAEAVRTAKLNLDFTLMLLGPAEQAEVLQLTGNTTHPILLEYKQAQLEEQKPLDTATGLKRIAELKKQLAWRRV
jgi:hypothetical protein